MIGDLLLLLAVLVAFAAGYALSWARARLTHHRARRGSLASVCSAHGNQRCTWCSLNPSTCAEPYPECGIYIESGMHWDTCANRVRGEHDARERGLWPAGEPFPELASAAPPRWWQP